MIAPKFHIYDYYWIESLLHKWHANLLKLTW